MITENPITLIENLPIQGGEPYRKKRVTKSFDNNALPIRAGEEQSFFNEKSLVSFASSVSEQNRNDVLQSTLLAQLAANHQVQGESDESKVLKWYTYFLDTLSKTGWIISGSDIQNYEAKDSSYEVDNIIIDILMAAFGSTYITIIKKTLEAIKTMGDDDRKIQAFKKNVNEISKGGFQIALANEEGGIVSIKIGTFFLTSSHEMEKVFFFKTEKDKTSLQYISKTATLSSKAYSAIRELIDKKLEDHLQTSVAEIKIEIST
jgi:hypothetical protein